MAVDFDIHSIESSFSNEIYITAIPKQEAPLLKQAKEIFTGINSIIQSKNAFILQERVFAYENILQEMLNIRSRAYGSLDDGVAPSLLLGKIGEPLRHKGRIGFIAGVQVHAVSCDKKPQVIDVNGNACGRILSLPAVTILTLSSISAEQLGRADEQAQDMLEKAEAALKQVGGDFLSVLRTWMWLGDILSWYEDFNRVRNKFFTERSLTPPSAGRGRQSMPASTGIGLFPANGGKCAMDLLAALTPRDSIKYMPALGRQQCALEYGSAFSRAARAITPAGETLFVSGTASIDADGNTTDIGDPSGQIKTAIDNIRADLKDTHFADKDVVQAVAYCKTAHVQQLFNEFKVTLPWPAVTVICDICRPDLMFEIEVTACRRLPFTNRHHSAHASM